MQLKGYYEDNTGVVLGTAGQMLEANRPLLSTASLPAIKKAIKNSPKGWSEGYYGNAVVGFNSRSSTGNGCEIFVIS